MTTRSKQTKTQTASKLAVIAVLLCLSACGSRGANPSTSKDLAPDPKAAKVQLENQPCDEKCEADLKIKRDETVDSLTEGSSEDQSAPTPNTNLQEPPAPAAQPLVTAQAQAEAAPAQAQQTPPEAQPELASQPAPAEEPAAQQQEQQQQEAPPRLAIDSREAQVPSELQLIPEGGATSDANDVRSAQINSSRGPVLQSQTPQKQTKVRSTIQLSDFGKDISSKMGCVATERTVLVRAEIHADHLRILTHVASCFTPPMYAFERTPYWKWAPKESFTLRTNNSEKFMIATTRLRPLIPTVTAALSAFNTFGWGVISAVSAATGNAPLAVVGGAVTANQFDFTLEQILIRRIEIEFKKMAHIYLKMKKPLPQTGVSYSFRIHGYTRLVPENTKQGLKHVINTAHANARKLK